MVAHTMFAARMADFGWVSYEAAGLRLVIKREDGWPWATRDKRVYEPLGRL